MPAEPVKPTPEPAKPEPSATAPPASKPEKTSDQDATPPTLEPAYPTGVISLIDQAKNDLARRQSLSLAEIETISFESKVWPDSSLGCPQPGMNYLQVLKEGYLIRLQVGDQVYNYHAIGETFK